MAGKSITLKAIRAHDGAQVPPRLGVRVIAAFVLLQLLLLLVLLLVFPFTASAAPVKAEVAVSTAGGYARLIFTLAEETEADVRVANGIVIIAFKRAVDVPLDRIPMQAGAYVGLARSDPDGTAIRLALIRKVTVNTMAAGEKLFVDLLPEGWTGLAPGLPQEVVEELARRARQAEKKARERLKVEQQRSLPPVRVRVGMQPTFTRYTFPLPVLIQVSTDRVEERMTFTFEAPLRFDLADVQAALPPSIASIDVQPAQDTVALRLKFVGKVDVRTFREDNDYIVDVQPIASRGEAVADAEKPERSPLVAALSEPRASPRIAESAQAPPVPPAKPATPAASAIASGDDARPQPQRPPVDATDPPATVPAHEAADAKPAPDAAAPVVAGVRRHGETLRLSFPFAVPTPAAMFRRADTIWLVFDSAAPIDIGTITAQLGQTIRNATVTRSQGGQVVTLKLARPKLTSVGAEGATWTVIVGDMVLEPTQPLGVVRLMQSAGRASATIPFADPHRLHRLSDPEVGDTLFVVTALGPARGFVKPQEFVEFSALISTHGVVVKPHADDLAAEITPENVVLTRPGGLTLSNASARAIPGGAQSQTGGESAHRGGGSASSYMLDPQNWGYDREASFQDRQRHLVATAAAAAEPQRIAARLELARFYLARDMSAEAKGVLDTVANDEHAAGADGSALMLRAVANVMLGRADDALKDLSQPAVGSRGDAALWRALALAQQGKWVEAREGLRMLDTSTATLPVELQRFAFQEGVRAAVEVGDFGAAAGLLNEFDTLGPSPAREADLALLKGRVMEGLGRIAEALTLYRSAASAADRVVASRARLREIVLRQTIGDMNREEAATALETLTTSWRGDETEAEALQVMGRFYAESGRHRDAFQVMRTALVTYPNSEMTRRIQDEAAMAFESLFLGGKGDAMPAIDALSLFYDFRDLTPVGRRGDEMIRKLADRLVTVDLLDQAAELLQHQVDNRLQGAARAQVAVRLCVIYLIARKPDRVLQVLRASRSADLPNELRNQRLLLEARALSDTGRADVALEVIANVQTPEVERLRADILWKARRWREAGEQIERYYGERWRDFAPLTEPERADVMRAAIGYALGDDTIGLDRFRTKYAPKMADGPDRRAFEVVTAPFNTNAPEFGDVARVAAAADTLDGFLRDIRARFPETTAPAAPAAQPVAPVAPGAPGPGAAAATGRSS